MLHPRPSLCSSRPGGEVRAGAVGASAWRGREAAGERGGCWGSCSSWCWGAAAPLATSPRCPYQAIESPIGPSSPPRFTCVRAGGEIRQGDSCVTVIFHSIILLPASTPSPRSSFFFFLDSPLEPVAQSARRAAALLCEKPFSSQLSQKGGTVFRFRIVALRTGVAVPRSDGTPLGPVPSPQLGLEALRVATKDRAIFIGVA